jgi:hypothetical protein
MYAKIDLLTNGMIENYPKSVYMDNIRVRHFKDLILASKVSEEAFNDVLTSVFDDLIDFEKTGFIKTTDELSFPDRQKLFYWQRINSKGSKFQITINCPRCEKDFDFTIDLLKIKENRLENKIKEKIVKDEENNLELRLGMPNRLDHIEMNKFIKNYKENVFQQIEKMLYVEDIELLENELKSKDFSSKKEMLTQFSGKKIVDDKGNFTEALNEFDKVSMDNINEKNKIKNKILELKEKVKSNKEEIKKILKKYFFDKSLQEVDTVDIKNSNDLKFDDYTDYMLTLGTCIKNKPKNYVEYIINLQYKVLNQVELYAQDIYHGFDSKVTFKCKECGHKFEDELLLTPSFFLS